MTSFAGVAAAAFGTGAPPDGDGEWRKQRSRIAVFRGIAIAGRAAKVRERRPVWLAAQVSAAAVLAVIGVLTGLYLAASQSRHTKTSVQAVNVARPTTDENANAWAELERYRQLAAAFTKMVRARQKENATLRGLLVVAEQRATALQATVQAVNSRFGGGTNSISPPQ